MSDWQKVLAPVAHNVEEHFDRLKYRLFHRLGGNDPIKIVPYRGYGNQQRLYLKGRVLEDPGVSLAEPNDKLWENLINMYRRMESDEIPHARVLARFAGQELEVQANEEGFFEVWIELTSPPPTNTLWHKVELELLHPAVDRRSEPVRAVAEVLVPPPTAEYIVISDIDDTVLQSDATHILKMARHVFMGNAHTRLPFPGVAALYRALYAGSRGGAMNPLFYVSSSPWNLYDLLAEFFDLQDIPTPVIFLRDWGLTDFEILPLDNRTHKLSVLKQMLDFYPHLPFILVGDSGQQDPEIYAEIVEQYPDRILAAYIRNVSRGLDRPKAVQALAQKVLQAGSTMVLGDNSLAIAQNAFEKGWIAAESFPDIRVEKAKDEAPPTPVEKLLGDVPPQAEKAEGPTVTVSGGDTAAAEQAVEEGAIEDALKETGDKKKEAPPTVIVESDEKNEAQRKTGKE